MAGYTLQQIQQMGAKPVAPSVKEKPKESFASKAGDFLGVKKFGQGIGTALFFKTREGKELLKRANEGEKYAAQTLNEIMNEAPTNKEIVGSAALTGLNALSGGVIKGAQTASNAGKLARGTAMGAAYGVAGGAEQNKSTGGIVKQGAQGAALGAFLSSLGIVGNKAKKATAEGSQKAAERVYNSAVKPTLSDTEKAISTGEKTLGRELLDRKISGGSRKLLEVSRKKLEENEEKLQKLINTSEYNVITKDEIVKKIKPFIDKKSSTPTLKSQRDLEKIERALELLPDKISLNEANRLKRNIYQELTDRAFKTDGSLASEAEVNKNVALSLKKLIEEKVGGDSVRLLNKELSIFKQLENAATENIARTSRNNIAGVGTVGAVVEKVVGAVPVKTKVATSLDEFGKAVGRIKADKAGKISKAAILNLFNSLNK